MHQAFSFRVKKIAPDGNLLQRAIAADTKLALWIKLAVPSAWR